MKTRKGPPLRAFCLDPNGQPLFGNSRHKCRLENGQPFVDNLF
jgi:hypothetical protein